MFDGLVDPPTSSNGQTRKDRHPNEQQPETVHKAAHENALATMRESQDGTAQQR
jgi:hypothetical protein